MDKGQSAIELMIILGVALAVLLFILSFSNEQIADINQDRQIKTAQTAANEIVSAANDVYFQGAGARKKVFYEVPSGIEEADSGIENKTVVFNVLGSDVFAQAEIQISGSLPTGPGGHWVWLEAKEGYVSIGIEYVSLSDSAIYQSMSQNSNSSKTIIVSNDYSDDADVSIVLTWPHSGVLLTLSDSSFSVTGSGTIAVDFNFSSTINASGSYSGQAQFNISYNDSDQNIIVPITVEVEASGQPGAGNLRIFPASYPLTCDSGSSCNGSFQACNTGTAELTSITFSNSSGDAGDWLSDVSSIASLAADGCQDKNFDANIPDGTSSGLHTGTITASSGSESDALTVFVTVPGDITLPVVLLEAPAPAYSSAAYTVQFDYDVVDADGSIDSCELIIDGVSGQTDNTITEGTTQSFTKVFGANGSYTWDVNCTDNSGNEGASGENRAITIAASATNYAMFTPSSGTDATQGTSALSAQNLSDVSLSDDTRYQSVGQWPKNGAGYSEYIEYVFTPSIPVGATINDVNITHEFSISSGTGLTYAKLQVWDGVIWHDEILLSNQLVGTTDLIHTVDVSSYIDTVTEANALTVRFVLYFSDNVNKKTRTDFVQAGFTYST